MTLFSNVRVFDGTNPSLSAPMNVLIRGNTIAKISAQPIPTDRRGHTVIVNGEGRTLMPRIFDNHVHIFVSPSTQEQLIDPKTTFEELNAEAERMRQRGDQDGARLGRPDVRNAAAHRRLHLESRPLVQRGGILVRPAGRRRARPPRKPAKRSTTGQIPRG